MQCVQLRISANLSSLQVYINNENSFKVCRLACMCVCDTMIHTHGMLLSFSLSLSLTSVYACLCLCPQTHRVFTCVIHAIFTHFLFSFVSSLSLSLSPLSSVFYQHFNVLRSISITALQNRIECAQFVFIHHLERIDVALCVVQFAIRLNKCR